MTTNQEWELKKSFLVALAEGDTVDKLANQGLKIDWKALAAAIGFRGVIVDKNPKSETIVEGEIHPEPDATLAGAFKSTSELVKEMLQALQDGSVYCARDKKLAVICDRLLWETELLWARVRALENRNQINVIPLPPSPLASPPVNPFPSPWTPIYPQTIPNWSPATPLYPTICQGTTEPPTQSQNSVSDATGVSGEGEDIGTSGDFIPF